MAIKLFWQGGERSEINFGDTLSPFLIGHLSGKEVVYAPPHLCDVAAIGSILDKIIKKQPKRKWALRFSPIHIWGSGSFGPEIIRDYQGLTIHAVRGPKTRDAMNLSGDMRMGDAGLMAPEFFAATGKKYRWGIIPHIADRSHPIVKDIAAQSKSSVIINLADPDIKATAQTISACDFILSSSLHGMITADAYGIPNYWLTLGDRVQGAEWKFSDYFESVGRGDVNLIAGDQCRLSSLENFPSQAESKQVENRLRDLHAAFKKMNI